MTNDNLKFKPVDKLEQSRSPVFPLPIFMLCGGIQRLRIFEQKYVAMVANCQQTEGFVIAVPSADAPSLMADWGAHVHIVDFNKGDGGILIIDVQADRLVTIADIERENSGLLTANISPLTHWSSEYDTKAKRNPHLQSNEALYQQLSSLLKTVFDTNNEFSKLYKSVYFESPEWVCARLLEIAPIPLSEKQKFIQGLDFDALVQFLSSICAEDNEQKSDPLQPC